MLLVHEGGRQGAGRSGVEEQRAVLSEHICPEGLQFENMYIPKPSVVMEYFETYILPMIFFM